MYYFIGIKGTGMSSLAVILKQMGYEVSGSDIDSYFFTESELVKNHIPFYVYNENNIKENYTIIKGASIKENNVELKRAKELNLEIFEYNQMVAKITNELNTIGVAGCHGKTTTTNMLSLALSKQGISYLIGDGTGYANKNNKYFALEADEYQRHFVLYKPLYSLILNIDLDHVDYYKGIDDLLNAYETFADNAKKYVVANGDDEYIKKLKINKPTKYFGLKPHNDIQATNIQYNQNGITFDVKNYGHFDLPIYGKGQLYDALGTISICILENIPYKEVNENLKQFTGAKRRMTVRLSNENVIIDDYAHHPNEIRATIEAVKQKYPTKKLVTIFKPHTFSRTKQFAEEMANELNKSDASYILDIHPARETQEQYPEVTCKLIIDKLRNGHYLKDNNLTELSKEKGNTVYLFMSPNDITYIEDNLTKLL